MEVCDIESIAMLCGQVGMGSGEKKTVTDNMLFGKGLDVIKVVVVDSGNLDIGSDHNLIWGEECGGGQRLT